METQNAEKKSLDFKKMQRIAGITAAVLAVVLLVNVVASVTNENDKKDDGQGAPGTETVTDTNAPKVTMKQRYIFTNDITKLSDFSSMVGSVADDSEYTMSLIRFEKKDELNRMDELALKNLTEGADRYPGKEDAFKVGTEEIPTQPGIYRSVLAIEDVHGNATYEEVCVILDKTGAKIEDVADKTITVSSENLSAEPSVDKSEYKITDNVDGKIPADDIICELELRDEAKYEWLVHVSYVDRAGNESKATFLIIVKEGATESTQTGNGGASNNGGTASNQGGNTCNGGLSNQGGNSNTGNNTNTETDKKPTNNQDVSTWVPTEDEHDISPYEQMVIDAGYGNVVDFGDGEYAVLTHGDGYVEGKSGGEILREYLANFDLSPGSVMGGWIDEDSDWYMWIAKNVRELITEDDEGYWDF